MVLPGDGFEGDATQSVVAQDPAVLALFRGEPRGFSETHANAFEPRLGAAYKFNEKTVLRVSSGVFHNRVTLNDSTLLGGNVPFQPQVTISNGSADNPGGGTVGSKDLPFTVTGQDVVFKHPTAYMYSVGIQREIPFGFTVDVSYVGRKGLYLQRERNLNQLLPGTIQANPGVNIAALRPYTGYGVIRLSENAGRSNYNSFQISADRRYTKGLKVGFAYTLGKSEDNGSDKRNVLWNTYDDTAYWGPSNYDRRHVLARLLHLRPAVLQGAVGTRERICSAAGRCRARRSSAPAHRSRSCRPARTSPASATSLSASRGTSSAIRRPTPTGSSRPAAPTRTSGSTLRRSPVRRPARSATRPRNLIYNPGEQQWDIAIFKNFSIGGTRRVQLRGRVLQLPEPPEPGTRRNVADRHRQQAHRGRPDQRQLRPRDQQERVSATSS